MVISIHAYIRKWCDPLGKTAAIHQVTTMLATSKNVLIPGHSHLLTTGTDDTSVAGAPAIIKALGLESLRDVKLNRRLVELG